MMRPLSLLALMAICFAPRTSTAAVPYIADPVEALRQVLRTPIRDPGNRDELLWRQDQLKACAKALGVGDLRRALLLQEWRYEDREEAIAAVDKPIRDSIVNRLIGALRKVVQSKRESAKLAGIAQIGEMGVAIFGANGRTNLASSLAPELAKLMNDPDPTVRQAAARAIGRINPDPKLATAALGGLLDSANPADRQAAAEGLLTLLRTTVQVMRNSGPNRLIISREEVAQVDRNVIPAAGHGAADPDPVVRKTCVEALMGGAGLLTELVADVPRTDFPPPGRRPSADERAEIEAYRASVEEERNLLLPVARALTAQGPALRRAIDDPVPEIRLMSERAFQEMGHARIKLLRKAASVPVLEDGKEPAKEKTEGRPADNRLIQVAAEAAQKPLPVPKPVPKVEGVPDPLLDALRLSLPALAEHAVSDAVPQIRLAAVDALETLGPEAAPAVPALARALQDCYVFVRWAAARVLGKVGPVDLPRTVPILAKMLSDSDLDVERVAANTLGIYGPIAAPAVPALAAAIYAGDPERRIDMIHTLVAMGKSAIPAIPAITSALANPDPRVRRSAAEALGHFGAAAQSAIPALERALNDPDGDVRKAASDAMLAITVGEE